MEKNTKIFFPNLNGVRAIAAFMVVLCHIEGHKKDFNFSDAGIQWMTMLGTVGVCVFFALSGFLITYLLLEEKKNFVKVDFKDFYIRRILRIWPLYYLLVIVGFFIYPGSMTAAKPLLLSIFFLPNIAFSLNLLPLVFDPIWSVGVEEQFYIFHPHFFRIKKNEHILYVLIIFIILFFVFFQILKHFLHNDIVNHFFYTARYDDMMIGAIVGVLYFNTKSKTFDFKFQRLFNLLFNKNVQVALIILFIVFVGIYSVHSNIPQADVIISALSALIVVNLCETSNSVISLDYKPLQYLGRISYGIYLLHKYPLVFAFYCVHNYLGGTSSVIQNIALYSITIVLVMALASVSYYGYERYFLLLKKRFQKVPNNVV